MSAITPDRLIEHWPTLTPEARRQIAESNGSRDMPFNLSEDEKRLLAQARDDFDHGRALDTDAYHAEMSAFMQRLASQSTS